MKCIRCQNDAKHSERTDGCCPRCRGAFAFEPQKGDKLTDAAFLAAIGRVSSEGRVRWSKHHLYYEVARKYRRPRTAAVVLLVLSALVPVVFAFVQEGAMLLLIPLMWLIAAAAWPDPSIRLPLSDFESMWDRWLAVHDEPAALIVKKELPPEERRELPTDVHAYSFDRAVICDRAETVDLLLANNFHFENNCAVLSINGYPQHVFHTVRAMLRNNPRLVVFALHDATVEGCVLAKRLSADREWFATGARVIDVGLRPGHAGPFRGLWGPPAGTSPHLSGAENRWLATYSVELAVIRPEQVIKRLFRAISASDAVVDSGVGYYVDSSSFGADASSSDGGGDSFG